MEVFDLDRAPVSDYARFARSFNANPGRQFVEISPFGSPAMQQLRS
jgi:hypothetical protein